MQGNVYESQPCNHGADDTDPDPLFHFLGTDRSALDTSSRAQPLAGSVGAVLIVAQVVSQVGQKLEDDGNGNS